MNTIINPIIAGFNPDPSIIRVGDDYYIATSTFEWFPGIQIHHSKDLIHWQLIGHVLSNTEHLDMKGFDNSDGVFAPALSYADDRFWVCFSNVNNCRGASWMSTPCFVTSAENINGPWTQPVSIGNLGFDPSLFHDDDGRKWVVNMTWDGRKKVDFFNGIYIQEFSVEQQQLIGPRIDIFKGSALGITEGPQLLKKDGYYYLITAEGGTGWDHAVTVCRAKDISGPYQIHPDTHILTSRLKQELALQRAGHGFFVETQTGEWYLSHLCSRPVEDPLAADNATFEEKMFSILGRETALQKVEWRDNWPYLAHGHNNPEVNVPAPNLPVHPLETTRSYRDEFDHHSLNIHLQTLREPPTEAWCSLIQRPGHLRLTGRQYLYSQYEQSMVARRIQSHYTTTETLLEFYPTAPQQMAGLVAYYSRKNHYFLKFSANDSGDRVLQVVEYTLGNYDERCDEIIINSNRVYMRLELDLQWYQFSYSIDGKQWHTIGPRLNSTYLSDEYGNTIFKFTGSFVALYACDVSGENLTADFDFLDYQERLPH